MASCVNRRWRWPRSCLWSPAPKTRPSNGCPNQRRSRSPTSRCRGCGLTRSRLPHLRSYAVHCNILETRANRRIKRALPAVGTALGPGTPIEAASMIGLVIFTHGRLAEEFVHAMEHVVGPQTAVSAICIGPDDDMERRRRDILGACQKVNDGGGVILLTDMFGGTPSNLAISVMEQTKAEVIAGLNLPMLIKLASVRHREDLPTCVAQAQEAGRKYISVASYVLTGEK